MIWPAYAISVGEFNNWLDGVIYQTARDSGGKNLRSSILYISELDPVLLILGAAALICAIIKKDYFILLWAFPYLDILICNWMGCSFSLEYTYYLLCVLP